MTRLFTPFPVGELELKNRIVIAPMCQYSSDDGNANDWHTIHLGHLALSGAGLLITEATAVNPVGRISPRDLGLYSDENESSLTEVVRSVRKYSDIPLGIQLSHAGRKASTQVPWEGRSVVEPDAGGWATVAPSAIPFSPEDPAPAEMDRVQIEQLILDFKEATQRAARIGFDLIEIHAAHGYLLHQFLSPLSNKRSDEFGGSLENRMRFPLEVFRVMREAFPADRPIGVRISATDWVDGGWDIEQSITFSRALAEAGCAYIHVSSGGLSPLQKIVVGPGYQVGFAAAVKDAVDIPVIAVGLITDPHQAEKVITEGSADLVALARAMLYNPRWPWHAAAELGAGVDAPPQYWRSAPREHKDLFITR